MLLLINDHSNIERKTEQSESHLFMVVGVFFIRFVVYDVYRYVGTTFLAKYAVRVCVCPHTTFNSID